MFKSIKKLSSASIWKELPKVLILIIKEISTPSNIYASKYTSNQSPMESIVKKAEEYVINQKLDNEYLPIEGSPQFLNTSMQMLFGKTLLPEITQQLATVQCLSSTGGLNFVLNILKEEYKEEFQITLPNYYSNTINYQLNNLNIDKRFTYNVLENLKSPKKKSEILSEFKFIPKNSTLILHTGANYPLTLLRENDWEEVSQIFKEKELEIVFIQKSEGIQTQESIGPMILAKNNVSFFIINDLEDAFGIKNHPVSTISYFSQNNEIKERVLANLKNIYVRCCFSSPPVHGARLAFTIFNNEEFHNEWALALEKANEIANKNRTDLSSKLEAFNPQKYSYLSGQMGKYCNIVNLSLNPVSR